MKEKPRPSYGVAPRLWEHAAVCLVLGSGPSLRRADVELARKHVDGCIAVNDSYMYAPDATALYCADLKWWKEHHGAKIEHWIEKKHYPVFTGQFRVTLGSGNLATGAYRAELILRKGPETGLSLDPLELALGRNGVYQATNLAIHFGAMRILYLGVDMQNAQSHFFGRHTDNSGPPIPTCLERFATLIKPARAAGIEIINCTRSTALDCFPKIPLEAALGLNPPTVPRRTKPYWPPDGPRAMIHV